MVSKVSILIPVYNQNVTGLVALLLKQAQALAVDFEIRVYDDDSQPAIKSQNQSIAQLPCVIYHELPENIGRSQIRFLLAQDARFNHLLFLDNDVLPVYPDFLARYLSQANSGVAVGGVAYKAPMPRGLELRWKYGKAREEASATQRQKTPYQRVFSSNIFVEKNLFLAYFPRQEVRGYGHEDTLFAHRLRENRIAVTHLDNPVWHLGLEPAPVFLLKANEAVFNLVQLYRQQQVGEDSRLFRAYRALRKWKAANLLQENSSWLLPLLKRNLQSRNPSLKLFDLYRLLLLNRYLNK